MRGLAQLVDEKSNLVFKVDLLWAMGDSLSGIDSYTPSILLSLLEALRFGLRFPFWKKMVFFI
jgi:hypothetical protein